MNKAFAIPVIVYFIVASAVMLVAFLSPEESWTPMLFASALLVPLYLWVRDHAKKVALSKKVDGKTFGTAVGWALMLFFLALLVRVPSVLMFNMPHEKAPLIYLIVLTIVLVEKTDLSAFGFKTQKMARALMYGAFFFIILQGTILLIYCATAYIFTNELAIASFNVTLFLLLTPFQILLVGISEEGLFRGYIQTSMEKFGSLRAVLFQSVLFGLWHFVWNLSPFDPFGMLQYVAFTFLFGLLFGYFYTKARNLAPLVLVHGLWNGFQYGLGMNKEVLDILAHSTFFVQILVWFLPYAIAVLAVLVFTKNWVKEL